MTTYRIDGIKYNPTNWASLDPSERAACNRFAAARERELNTITTAEWVCVGGPFAGSKIEIESTTEHTAAMTVGAWSGQYELTGDPYKKDTPRRLVGANGYVNVRQARFGHACELKPQIVAGVKVYPSQSWSSYA